MRKQSISLHFSKLTKLGLIGGALVFGLNSYGFAQSPASADKAYRDVIHECEQISDSSERQNCKRDAAAALQEARKNPDKYKILDEQTLLKNRTARCDALPVGQKELCIQNMQEADNTQITGSVIGGGVLRRTTITEHGESYTVPVSELPENYQNDPNHRITIKRSDEADQSTLPKIGRAHVRTPVTE